MNCLTMTHNPYQNIFRMDFPPYWFWTVYNENETASFDVTSRHFEILENLTNSAGKDLKCAVEIGKMFQYLK